MYYRQKLRNELEIPMEAKVLLSVGELNENKNHQVVIRVLEQLKNLNIHYIIVGQGVLFTKLKLLAKNLGILEQIHLLGYRNDVTEIYQMADIFVFPSKREGLSVALMEAMASGLPAICGNIRGNRDLIKDGKGGILVQSDSVEEYGNAIMRLSSNMKLRKKMGDLNMEKVRWFGADKIEMQMSKLYKELKEI